jgi:hypothetical protein
MRRSWRQQGRDSAKCARTQSPPPEFPESIKKGRPEILSAYKKHEPREFRDTLKKGPAAEFCHPIKKGARAARPTRAAHTYPASPAETHEPGSRQE